MLPSGKSEIVFSRGEATSSRAVIPLKLPCGQCIGCRLERSRQWAIRCVNEASLYDDNCFLTLTYDDAHLPLNGSLVLRDYQLFMKRLRKEAGPGIRYFHCGEYGEKLQRPHYHACIFNFDFKDKAAHRLRGENMAYRSPTLERLWPHGFSEIGSVTFESAAYVARYIMKKVTGVNASFPDSLGLGHYDRVNEFGEIVGLAPEYVTMSRRPGIGKAWFDKFKSDMYPHGYVALRGKQMRPPRFYDSLYEISDPVMFNSMKLARAVNADSRKADNTDERLAVKEEIKQSKLSLLSRPMEAGYAS